MNHPTLEEEPARRGLPSGPIGSTAPLTQLVGIETLQRLQDRFAALGRMTVVICSVDGELITRPTWGSHYSQLIGASPRGREELADSIRKSLSNPESTGLVICHEGMNLYAAPIEHEHARLAMIVVGTRMHAPPAREIVQRIAEHYDLDPETLFAEATQIDPFRGGAPDAIHRFADVQAHMIATLYDQALSLERHRADLRAIHRLSDLLAGTLDLQEILDLTVRRVVDAMPVKACGIRLLNEQTGELVIKAVFNLSEEYLRKGPVMLHDSAIDSTAFAGEAVNIADAPNDPRLRYPDNARREGIVSGLCVPMTYRGQTVGVVRVYTGQRYAFGDSEEALLRSIGSLAASAIINSRLFEQQAQAERVKRQVEAAGQIQRRMLPALPPRCCNLQFGRIYEPTLQVGGDFYDFIDLPGGEIGVGVADVVGKGLPAALMMASMRAALRALARCAYDMDATMDEVNRHMYRDTLTREFATLVYVVFPTDGRSLTYSNAGHPPPLLLRGERFIDLTTGGMVIGVNPEERYEHEDVPLRPDDLLVMYTDGVTEAMDFQGTDFGRERLLASIGKHRSLHPQHLVRQILWDVRRFVGLADQSDDITIVAVRVV